MAKRGGNEIDWSDASPGDAPKRGNLPMPARATSATPATPLEAMQAGMVGPGEAQQAGGADDAGGEQAGGRGGGAGGRGRSGADESSDEFIEKLAKAIAEKLMVE